MGYTLKWRKKSLESPVLRRTSHFLTSFFSSFFLLRWSQKLLLLRRLRLKTLFHQYPILGMISDVRLQDYPFITIYTYRVGIGVLAHN